MNSFLGQKWKYAVMTLGLVSAVSSSHAQHYTNGQTGTFGLGEEWRASQPGFSLLDDTSRQYSVRFTAMENVTVDRVFQRMSDPNVDTDGGGPDLGTVFRVGIQLDDGSGNPDGTFLSFADVTAVSGPLFQQWVFGSTALTAGQVYHVVSRVQTAGTGGNGVTDNQFHRSTVDNDIRAYDRALDTSMSDMANTGSGWVSQNRDPYFVFANASSTAYVEGPGNLYHEFAPAAYNPIDRNDPRKLGQVFQITDKEVPTGGTVTFNQFKLTLTADPDARNNNQTLIVAFRDFANTVLAHEENAADDVVDGTETLFTLNNMVTLTQGVPYVLTTEFGDGDGLGGSTDGAAGETFTVRQYTGIGGGDLPGFEMKSGWGGTNISYTIVNTGGNWSTADFVSDGTEFTFETDIKFGFEGLVVFVPEPSAMLLLLMGGLLLGRKYRRG